MGPIHKADSRLAVVRRMIDLLDQAKEQKCDLVVYPELALTTFFPRWYMTEQAEVDAWFERVTRGLSDAQKADLKKKMSRPRVVMGVSAAGGDLGGAFPRANPPTLKSTAPRCTPT